MLNEVRTLDSRPIQKEIITNLDPELDLPNNTYVYIWGVPDRNAFIFSYTDTTIESWQTLLAALSQSNWHFSTKEANMFYAKKKRGDGLVEVVARHVDDIIILAFIDAPFRSYESIAQPYVRNEWFHTELMPKYYRLLRTQTKPDRPIRE